MWLHASPNCIADGEWILPPSQSGLAPQWTNDVASLERALELDQYSLDHVCIFDSEGSRVRDHVNRFSFTADTYYIYEVEPAGSLERDPDPAALSGWRCCLRARVISCQYRPEAATGQSDHAGSDSP